MAKAADITKTLDRALAKLTKNDDEGSLDALLSAWRSRRVPRIADVIDRVSDRLMDARGGPVTAKTVTERTAKWIKLAKKKDPADLGSLLATPWPGTWQDAEPVLLPLLKFEDDPRMAMALARLADATPFDTWTSRRFYRPLFHRLGELLDLRTLAILEADLEREKSTYYMRGTRPIEVAAANAIKAAYPKGEPPSLSPQEEEALGRLEGVFASSVSDERAKARGESDFLAAIYADPDDDALREVFADWLSERNDPRGELITLQLARHSGRFSDASLKRESALLNKYGKAWAGALDRVLEKGSRVFERGFLASGVLAIKSDSKDPPKILSHPAWATFRSLELGYGSEELAIAIIALPSMKWLRVVRGLTEEALVAVAKMGRRERFDELDFNAREYDDDDEAATPGEAALEGRALIVEAKEFPNVKRLSVTADVDKLEWVLNGALGRRLERLTVYNYNHPIGDLARLVERLKSKSKLPELTEVCVTSSYHRGNHWLLTARADADGRFTKIHGEAVGTRALPSRYDLERALANLKPLDLTELTIEREHVLCNYGAADIEAIEGRLATFNSEKLTRVEVPWERVKQSGTPSVGISLDLTGKRLAAKAQLRKLWELGAEPPLSLSFDSYSVNAGKHTALPAEDDDALEHIVGYYEKKRTRSLQLYRKDSRDTCALNLDLSRNRVSIVGGWRDEKTFVDDYVSWLTRLLDSINVDEGTLPFVRVKETPERLPYSLEPLQRSPLFGWVMILGAAHEKLLSFDDLKRLERTPDFEWLRVTQTTTKRNVILVLGATPVGIPDENRVSAFQIGIASVMWKGYARTHGFVPQDLAIEILGPRLEELGFEQVELSPLQHGLGQRFFRARDPRGARGIRILPVTPMHPKWARLRFELLHFPDNPDADLLAPDPTRVKRTQYLTPSGSYGSDHPATDAKVARVSLEKVHARIDSEMMPWFRQEPPTPKKKKR